MSVHVDNQVKDRRVSVRDLKRIANIICEAIGFAKAELSIVLTDDVAIHTLNKQWRGKDKPTDVLSFPQEGFEHTRVLGDVVISVETAARQAPKYGNDFQAELERLIVHGVLHLIGHDHVHGGPQARKMKREEERLLRALAAAKPPPQQTRRATRPAGKAPRRPRRNQRQSRGTLRPGGKAERRPR